MSERYLVSWVEYDQGVSSPLFERLDSLAGASELARQVVLRGCEQVELWRFQCTATPSVEFVGVDQ